MTDAYAGDALPHGRALEAIDARGQIEASSDAGGQLAAPAADLDSAPDAAEAALQLVNSNPNQLALLFQGEVYVFDSVTPEKVQAVLLLLGGCEVPSGLSGLALPCQQVDRQRVDSILQRTNIPAKRLASLIRFREKRKERCFDKKIRYDVRKEVALRMKRWKGQFAGKVNPDDEASPSSSCDPASIQGDTPQETNCQNCGINAKLTPAMRRGPGGPRSLCNACGLMWANKGTLRNVSKQPIMASVTVPDPNGMGEPVISETGSEHKPVLASTDNGSAASQV